VIQNSQIASTSVLPISAGAQENAPVNDHTVKVQPNDQRSIDEVLNDPKAQAQAESWALPSLQKKNESPEKHVESVVEINKATAEEAEKKTE